MVCQARFPITSLTYRGGEEEEEGEGKVETTWSIQDELTEDSSDDTGDEEEDEAFSKSKYTKAEALAVL